ncbi:MAG: fibronectin type III domain-containing protein, partial [Chloroflexota bacterium]|nr:fibronectin type III domain-containing protein [Chloroflexota bacterium]
MRGGCRWALALAALLACAGSSVADANPETRSSDRTLAPVAPTGLTASAGNGRVVLDWADSADSGIAGYNVYRGTSSPVNTGSTPLNGSTPISASAYTDTVVTNGTIYSYVVTAVAAGGALSPPSSEVSAMPDVPSPTIRALPMQVNFQSQAAPIPSGYTADYGQNYANIRGSGWVMPGTHTPLSLVGNGRDRNRPGIEQRLDTILHMQANSLATFSGVRQPGAWEIAIPNGSYRVVVSVGDAPNGSGAYDSFHTIDVEGVRLIDRFHSTSSSEYSRATAQVTVADGRLTLDASGGSNTKINYLEVFGTGASDPAPSAPTAVAAAAGDAQATVTWNPNTEPDLAGYNIYRGTSLPVPTTSPLNGQSLLTVTNYVDEGLANGTTYYYVVEAVDVGGNRTAATPVSATPIAPTTVDLKVNFQNATADMPAGHLRDFGEAFGAR